MAQIKSIKFAKVGKQDGVICDRCGQYIMNIWTVKYSDGVEMHFGIDCFEKLTKESNLTQFGAKLLKKTMKNIESYSNALDEYVSGKKTAENDTSWQYIQSDKESYWHDKTFDEYRKWMINEWFPARFEEAQKQIDRFKKVNFAR